MPSSWLSASVPPEPAAERVLALGWRRAAAEAAAAAAEAAAAGRARRCPTPRRAGALAVGATAAGGCAGSLGCFASSSCGGSRSVRTRRWRRAPGLRTLLGEEEDQTGSDGHGEQDRDDLAGAAAFAFTRVLGRNGPNRRARAGAGRAEGASTGRLAETGSGAFGASTGFNLSAADAASAAAAIAAGRAERLLVFFVRRSRRRLRSRPWAGARSRRRASPPLHAARPAGALLPASSPCDLPAGACLLPLRLGKKVPPEGFGSSTAFAAAAAGLIAPRPIIVTLRGAFTALAGAGAAGAGAGAEVDAAGAAGRADGARGAGAAPSGPRSKVLSPPLLATS